MLVICCLEVYIRIRRYTNKRGMEQTHIHDSRLILDFDISLFMSKMWIPLLVCFDLSYVSMLLHLFTYVFHCWVYLVWVRGIWWKLCTYEKTLWHGYIFKFETILMSAIWDITQNKYSLCYLMYLECYFCCDIVLFWFMLIFIFRV